MMLTRVGDCLSYGIGKEFCAEKNIRTEHRYLKAVIIYLWLRGCISRDNVEECKKLLSFQLDTLQKSIRNDILEILTQELKEKFHFPDADSFFKGLNTMNIPEWIFQQRDVLWNIIPNIYMVNRTLYYIVKIDGRFYFRKLHVTRCREELTQFDQDYYSSRDSDLDNDDCMNHTISNAYSEILTYDENSRRFFLRMTHDYNVYAEYYIDTEQEMYHYSCRCIGIIENRIPVIEVADTLYAVVDGKNQRIMHTNGTCNYEIRKKQILVKPLEWGPVMFEPYMITLDGKREAVCYAESARYMLQKIVDDIRDLDHNLFLYKTRVRKVTKFSLAFLHQYLENEYDSINGTVVNIYLFLVEILERCLDPDIDVLPYFYLLSDISRRYRKNVNSKVISEEFFEKFIRLHSDRVVRAAMGNVEELRKVLMQYVYWDDKMINEKWDRLIDCRKLGCFTINKCEKIQVACKKNISEAIIVGSQLIPWNSNSMTEGMVSYNIETGSYDIRYDRLLTEPEIDAIRSEFNLDEECVYRIIIDA